MGWALSTPWVPPTLLTPTTASWSSEQGGPSSEVDPGEAEGHARVRSLRRDGDTPGVVYVPKAEAEQWGNPEQVLVEVSPA